MHLLTPERQAQNTGGSRGMCHKVPSLGYPGHRTSGCSLRRETQFAMKISALVGLNTANAHWEFQPLLLSFTLESNLAPDCLHVALGPKRYVTIYKRYAYDSTPNGRVVQGTAHRRRSQWAFLRRLSWSGCTSRSAGSHGGSICELMIPFARDTKLIFVTDSDASGILAACYWLIPDFFKRT